MVRRLRLAFLSCCVCMLLMFVFTWHPLKEKISGEQVPRGLLSCERLREVILIFSERKVVFVDGCWIKRPGETKVRLFRWWRWLKFIFEQQSRWSTILLMALQTFLLHYRNHMHLVHVQDCDLWCFLLHILEIQKILIFEHFFFLQSGLLFFCLCIILLMVTFLHSAQYCVYCVDPHGLIFILNFR